VGSSCVLLARILSEQGELGDEARGLFERYIAISIRNEGADGSSVGVGNINIGRFYFQLSYPASNTIDVKVHYLLKAKAYCEEGVRISKKVGNPNHPNYIAAERHLAGVLSELARLGKGI
jgi:hypothetical protein